MQENFVQENSAQENYARSYLVTELSQRKKRNPSYSMRALARDLDVGVATLSDFLAGKRGLASKTSEKICRHLPLDLDEREHFILSSQLFHDDVDSEDSVFRVMSHWYYFAILNLAKSSSCHTSAQDIAYRFGLSISETVEALDELEKMGLISFDGDVLVRSRVQPSIKAKVPLLAVRRHHMGLLSQAGLSLIRDPFQWRDMRTMAIAIDPAYIMEARQMLLDCRDRIAEFLSPKGARELYLLTYHLFPVKNGL
jgi:hypothetical protein